jgi:hypothetical protein
VMRTCAPSDEAQETGANYCGPANSHEAISDRACANSAEYTDLQMLPASVSIRNLACPCAADCCPEPLISIASWAYRRSAALPIASSMP